MTPLFITACYAFLPLAEERLPSLQNEMRQFGKEQGMRGLVLIAPEGINGTVCGSSAAINAWKTYLTDQFGAIVFKDSTAADVVFKRWSVKIKPEIVGLKRPDIRPEGKHRHLTPAEWNEMLEQDDVVVLDARNDYEVAIGKFKNAIDPNIRNFGEFTAYAASHPVPKDKKVLMYCTGGIRCEKALIAMEEQGYEHVYQLEGGILAYLQQFPEGQFEGECFVFDKRTAVDRHLQPSQAYDICPHCGLPGDQAITCAQCEQSQKICVACNQQEHRRTCSKRCANEMGTLSASGSHPRG